MYQVKEEGEDDVETTRRDTFLRNCKELYGLEFESEVCTGEGKGSRHIATVCVYALSQRARAVHAMYVCTYSLHDSISV